MAVEYVRCHGCAFQGLIQHRPILLRYNLPAGEVVELGRVTGWCVECAGLRDVEPILAPELIRRQISQLSQDRQRRGGFFVRLVDRALGGGPDGAELELQHLSGQLRLAELRKSKPRCLTCAAPGAVAVDFGPDGTSVNFRHNCGSRLYIMPSDPDAPRFSYRPESIDLDSEGTRLRPTKQENSATKTTDGQKLSEAKYREYVENWLSLDFALSESALREISGSPDYQDSVRKGWDEGISHGDTALIAAANYYAKLALAGDRQRANALAARISASGKEAMSEGYISMDAIATALATIEWANSRK